LKMSKKAPLSEKDSTMDFLEGRVSDATAGAKRGDADGVAVAVANVTLSDVRERKGEFKIEEDYEVKQVLGTGAFSEVKLGISKANKKKYAIKCINKKKVGAKELTALTREIGILKKLRHPNIIQLVEVLDTSETLFLVLEFAEGGELFDAIVARGHYEEADAAQLISQMLHAIHFCHEQGIAHRDLKPENLLLSKDDAGKEILKIADFGLSKDFGESTLTTKCGTADYVAPEVLAGEEYDKTVDIWSTGVISYILLCGYPPFFGDSDKQLFENIMACRYDFPEQEWGEISKEAKNFVESCLVLNPAQRPTADKILKHEWLRMHTELRAKKRGQSFSMKKFMDYAVRRKN